MTDGSYPDTVINGVPVVATPAEIDITNAQGLQSALLKAAANGHSTLVVDMTQTRFCDSSGLHTLIDAHKRAQAEGREVLLAIPGTTVLRVFAITGMDKMIPQLHQPGQGPGSSGRHRVPARGQCPQRADGAARGCRVGRVGRCYHRARRIGGRTLLIMASARVWPGVRRAGRQGRARR